MKILLVVLLLTGLVVSQTQTLTQTEKIAETLDRYDKTSVKAYDDSWVYGIGTYEGDIKYYEMKYIQQKQKGIIVDYELITVSINKDNHRIIVLTKK